MIKWIRRFGLLLFVFSFSPGAKAGITLEPMGVARFPPKKIIQKTRVGGLSGMTYADGKIWMVSDDRGKFGRPRVFIGTLAVEPKIIWKITDVLELKNVPGVKDLKHFLDPEGFVRLASGDWLVTSEADTDRKPRETNRLIRFAHDGTYIADIDFPSQVQPNPTGQQKRGTMNNFGPEGLTVCENGSLWTAMERPLVQSAGQAVRFDRWEPKDKTYVSKDDHSYTPEEPNSEDREVFRGVSEILCMPDGKLLVLERSATLTMKGLGFGGGLFLADCTKEKCVKSEVLRFGRDLVKIRDGQPIVNFEGLSWGPILKDGRKTILMVSDDNFDRTDGSELVVMILKERP